MNGRQPFLSVARYLVSVALLIGFWALVVRIARMPAYLLPDPLYVFDTLTKQADVFLTAGIETFTNALIGGALGISSGFLVGALAAYSRKIRWVAEPYLTIFQSFPREAFFPLLIVWLGFGMMPKVVNAVLLSSFPMAIVTLNGLSDTRDEYIRLMESWKASRFEIFVSCRLPAAIPQLIGGMRVALPLALIGAVLGEFLGGSGGLGYIIISSGSAFRVDRTFAAIVVLALGGTLMIAFLDLIRFTFLRRFYQS